MARAALFFLSPRRSHPRPATTLLPSHSMSSSSSNSKPSARRPKRKTYHRDPNLDKAIDLHKKPAALLRLRSLIAARPTRSLPLRDLEKDVGFIHKWNLLSLIQRHPSVFRASGGAAARAPISFSLTDKAHNISAEEPLAREQMEPILVRNLKKLLMMSLDCQIPTDKIELIGADLGLPDDFRNSFIPKFPGIFAVRSVNGREYVCLESWDSSIAVTAREERLDLGSIPKGTGTGTKLAIARDGNFPGPFAFKMKFAPGFRANTHYLEELRRWQRMPFPSPYLNARRVVAATPQARKRVVAVLHELLSLTMEKRLTSDKLDAFHREYQLPCRLLLCLVKNHGIFYITNKGARSTVFLKEAYDGSNLIEKCPLLRFRDRFTSLVGRTYPDMSNAVPV